MRSDSKRGAMDDCDDSLKAGDLALFSSRWADFKRWQVVHAAMEVRGGGLRLMKS